MPLVLVSNNSELLKHLTAPPFRRLELEPRVASNGNEARKLFEAIKPPLAILDAEMPGISGYELTEMFKGMAPTTRVVLVVGKRLTGEQMRRATACGCDDVLIAPMSADELYDVVAIHLAMPRLGAERYKFEVIIDNTIIEALISNLSIDGARVVIQHRTLSEGARIVIRVTPEGSTGGPPTPHIDIPAKVVWTQAGDSKSIIGAEFIELDELARNILSRLTQWEIVDDTQRMRVVMKGDFTEATRFDELLPSMAGRIDFDMAQVRYINSLGVQAWCDFLRRAPIQGYEFHACSIPFVLQASMVADVIGRGTVTSFFAPFHCNHCDHQEERLLQSAALLAARLEPPRFQCPNCEGELTFDELPERYFAFLSRTS